MGCDLYSFPEPNAPKNPMVGITLCHRHLKIINNCWARAQHFNLAPNLANHVTGAAHSIVAESWVQCSTQLFKKVRSQAGYWTFWSLLRSLDSTVWVMKVSLGVTSRGVKAQTTCAQLLWLQLEEEHEGVTAVTQGYCGHLAKRGDLAIAVLVRKEWSECIKSYRSRDYLGVEDEGKNII